MDPVTLTMVPGIIGVLQCISASVGVSDAKLDTSKFRIFLSGLPEWRPVSVLVRAPGVILSLFVASSSRPNISSFFRTGLVFGRECAFFVCVPPELQSQQLKRPDSSAAGHGV